MIERFWISGYRSIRNLDLDLGNLVVILGGNGVGKTNLYRGLELIQAAAHGSLARDLAGEGGMPSALWAGAPWRTEEERETFAVSRAGPSKITLGARVDHLSYDLSIGLPNPISEPALPLDPVIRDEAVHAHAGGRKVAMMKRKGPLLQQRDNAGKMIPCQSDLLMAETALSAMISPDGAAETALLQHHIRRWRFFHQFRTDKASPLRQPHFAICAPELDSSGENWAAVLLTQRELGDGREVTDAIDAAFPGGALDFQTDGARVDIRLQTPEFQRPFGAAELSDGMLRYLCLIAAFKSYRLPPFIALNEPETSLHQDLIPPLAHLIGGASRETQILVVTHAPELAEILDLDYAADVIRLEKVKGETRVMD